MTIHNLSTFNLTPQHIQILTKGLSFSPTPRVSHTDLHRQILHSFDNYAKSLRLKYKRAQCTRQRQHHKPTSQTTTSNIYRCMKFLPPPTVESPQERYTGIAHLEKYIDDTKHLLNDNLPTICENQKDNLTFSERKALAHLIKERHAVTVKPADKNLGIVIMNTEDYIQQCMKHLSDESTYRLATEYPATDMERRLTNVIIAFQTQLENLNKRLYTYLKNGIRKPRIPQFYGIPKLHKKYDHLPPVRPIVSQTLSRLTPSAQFIDHVLQPLAQLYPDFIRNSTALSLHLRNLYVPDKAILVTIDVISLYPSIPQTECLKVIYSEMNSHAHLMAFDPNLIIRLLQINMNYNYFNFSNLTFQQISGTAMGAVFSPTIANIYMSTIVRDFIQTQTVKPLTFVRYIDDIFMIWTDTHDKLNNFLTDLNSFHTNLNFTHEQSSFTVNFLDLTIYKGTHFHFTNLLDTKTFHKPQNLYQYLHFTSAHPPKVFKALIKGECIRYVRTNTTYETYIATVHEFKARLRKRNYPNQLINKTINIVKYHRRQQYLKQCQPLQPTCSPPIFKLVPPPRYQLLKKLVLQDYAQLQFTSPRFITIRHPTLKNMLIRSALNPTDEQLMDIFLYLDNTTPSTHTTAAKLPILQYTTPRITSCGHPKCATCSQHLLVTSTFQDSHRKPTAYRIRHSMSCKSTNVIYLITCNKCKKQYVGNTSKQLNTRINHHRSNILNKRSTYIAQHFNLPDHSLSDLRVKPIDKVTETENSTKELLCLENFWITTLRTIIPDGLNVSPGVTFN